VEAVIQFPFANRELQHGVRRSLLKTFNLSVVYYAVESDVVFLGVFHNSQDFARWLRRRYFETLADDE
jgi:hypothetical protein